MNKLRKQKLQYWKEKEEELKERLSFVMQSRGKAAQEGDLRENAAYDLLTEEQEVLNVQLANIQKIIQGLEKEN